MEVDVGARQHEEHITRMIAWIVETKTDYSRLPVLLIDRLKRKNLSVHQVGLGIVSYSLLVRHLFTPANALALAIVSFLSYAMVPGGQSSDRHSFYQIDGSKELIKMCLDQLVV